MYRIMFVEDDEKISAVIAGVLVKWRFDVLCVRDFNAVMEDFARFKPHLVLFDINLPVYDGYYWGGKSREVSRAPVLFISSRTQLMQQALYIEDPFYGDA